MSVTSLRVLYICYLSLDDPLTHTQVVAYLEGLADSGHRIHLLTFEPRRWSRSERQTVRGALAARGIAWHNLRYHKRPSLPATVFDVVVGALFTGFLIARFNLNTLHARSHVPAAMVLMCRKLTWRRRPALVFDIRGLMAEEYEDAGRWQPGGIPSRLTKAVERRSIRAADGIVVLTERVREQLLLDDTHTPLQVIPCCADLEKLAVDPAVGTVVRSRLGIDLSATVLVYVGKFGGWYMAAEMARFFAVASRAISNLHFLILTQGAQSDIEDELAKVEVGTSGYTITSAPAGQVGAYLAAGDFGISFIRPAPSKISSSPTKVGEYLAAGLPLLTTSGVGDLDCLITPEVGVVVSEHSDESYMDALRHMTRLLQDPGTSARCRALAARELSLLEVGIPRYRRLYDQVAQRLGP